MRYTVGTATLVRVPYVDLLVDADVVGLTPEQVAANGWAAPTWAEGDQVRVGAAVWVIESDGRRIAVDPTQAADEILRSEPDAVVHQEAVAGALESAGFPRESIDTVIATHIDGIGMMAWRTDDGWTPFFPEADLLISRREHEAIAARADYRPSGAEAYLALHRQSAVTPVGDEHTVTSEVTMRWTGAHSPGHAVVDIESGHERATMIGHLALTPVHCAVDARLHEDPAAAEAILRRLADGRLLIGPLWPVPGAARWTGDDLTAAIPVG